MAEWSVLNLDLIKYCLTFPIVVRWIGQPPKQNYGRLSKKTKPSENNLFLPYLQYFRVFWIIVNLPLDMNSISQVDHRWERRIKHWYQTSIGRLSRPSVLNKKWNTIIGMLDLSAGTWANRFKNLPYSKVVSSHAAFTVVVFQQFCGKLRKWGYTDKSK